MDNGHGACVADEHVACTKQVIQELPVSHWSVTAHCTGILWYCSFGQCSLIINVEMVIAYSNEYLHTSIN